MQTLNESLISKVSKKNNKKNAWANRFNPISPGLCRNLTAPRSKPENALSLKVVKLSRVSKACLNRSPRRIFTKILYDFADRL